MNNGFEGLLMSYISDYCHRGVRVFPVSSRKVPLVKGWPEMASSNLEKSIETWQRHRSENVAIASGKGSGLWVLDIDNKNGVNGLESIAAEFDDFDPTIFEAHVRSPSGGLHVYFEWSDDLPITVASNVLPGVDIRGERGFIMAPPSQVYLDGELKSYTFLKGGFVVEPPPDWAIELARRTLKSEPKRRSSQGSAQFDVSTVMQGVSEGNRDNAIYRYACHLKSCGVPLDLAVSFITEAAKRCHPPFSEALAIEKINRAYSYIPKRRKIFNIT